MENEHKFAMQQMVAMVDMQPDLPPDRLALFATAATETAMGITEVLQVSGYMGAMLSLTTLFKAAYLLGVRDGKAKGGLTLVVAPEAQQEGL